MRARVQARALSVRLTSGLTRLPLSMKKGPDEDLIEQFRLLESRIDAALELIVRLKEENQELRGRLAEAERVQQKAVQRIDAVLDKIDVLT